MKILRWLAVPPLAVGCVLLFFGLVWTAATQVFAAMLFFAVAAVVWRAFDGTWPLTPARRPGT